MEGEALSRRGGGAFAEGEALSQRRGGAIVEARRRYRGGEGAQREGEGRRTTLDEVLAADALVLLDAADGLSDEVSDVERLLALKVD